MSVQYVDMVDATTKSHDSSKVNFPVVTDKATSIPLMPFELRVTVPNASTNLTIQAPCALTVSNFRVIKTTTSADAGDTVQLFNGATAVSSVLALNVATKVIVATTTLDPAATGFALGATITVDPTSSTNCDCLAIISCVPQ